MVEANGDLHRQAEIFLYREAKLLDDGQLDEWLNLFTDDVRYWMPITESLAVGAAHEGAGEWSIIEEDKRFLALRCERLGGNFAHSEQPRSRTRRFISNVLATPNDDGALLDCNFIVFQSRTSESETFFVGRRRDRVVIADETWKIAERSVFLDHRVLPRAISFFF